MSAPRFIDLYIRCLHLISVSDNHAKLEEAYSELSRNKMFIKNQEKHLIRLFSLLMLLDILYALDFCLPLLILIVINVKQAHFTI